MSSFFFLNQNLIKTIIVSRFNIFRSSKTVSKSMIAHNIQLIYILTKLLHIGLSTYVCMCLRKTYDCTC